MYNIGPCMAIHLILGGKKKTKKKKHGIILERVKYYALYNCKASFNDVCEKLHTAILSAYPNADGCRWIFNTNFQICTSVSGMWRRAYALFPCISEAKALEILIYEDTLLHSTSPE